MASEITLKYLHPSIKSYITTENYSYDTSVSNEILFVADVFEHGKDNVLQQVNTVTEYLFKYGDPNYAKYGQAGYNVEKWLTNGGSAVIMRLLPDNASYAHAVLNVQLKSSTNGKTVINNDGEETKIDDVYLRPLVAYIGVNKTSEALLEAELAEDRSEYATTDGYTDNFIFAVYPEGRGEYYNDLGFRIRLNSSYDTTLTSRVYTFEVIKFTSSGTYDIIDGPYFVSFDPDAIDPNSQKSMFIENVVNTYSEYVKVKFNNDNFIKVATAINDEVDPYIIDIISGQSRILENGEEETFESSKTGKEENVHIALHAYSSAGSVLSSNGNIILNISNNDEASSDIVDIADNSRRVIYNNQFYITQYMRTFYNWLINDKIAQNLNKILDGTMDGDNLEGLLKEKADNLIFNHFKNENDSETYAYSWNGNLKADSRGNWYTKAIEIANPNVDVSLTGTELENAFSSSEMTKVITEDGYVEETNEHLISYYNNFMKYFQYVINYNVVDGSTFVNGEAFSKLKELNDKTLDKSTVEASTNEHIIFRKISNNGTDVYSTITNKDNNVIEYMDIDSKINEKFIFSNNQYTIFNKTGDNSYSPIISAIYDYQNNNELIGYVFDSISEKYIPITDYTLYDESGKKNINGDYITVFNMYGDEIISNVKNIIILPFTYSKNRPTCISTIYYPVYFSESQLVKLKNKFFLTNINTHEVIPFDASAYSDFKTEITEISDYFNDNLNLQYNSSLLEENKLNADEVYVTIGGLNRILSAIQDKNYNNWNIISLSDLSNYSNSLTYSDLKALDTNIYSLSSLINGITITFNKTPTFEVGTAPGGFSYRETGNYIKDELILLASLYFKYKIFNNYQDDKVTLFNGDNYASISKLTSDKYYSMTKDNIYNESFTVYGAYNKLTQAINKVSSYAGLISKELDGKGKDEINDIENIKKPVYNDFSLTTIFNFLVGGFESVVNNQGSITDYSNYASLKYLIKNINNKLDLRSTYLTILNVHKNTVLDLSTDLAKNNISVILGDETLEFLYATLDSTVKEINYLISNIIMSLLNKTYTLQDLETMYLASNSKPYARYFTEEDKVKNVNVDPLGINSNYKTIGLSKNVNLTTENYNGILPILESCLIDLIGENHIGDKRYPAFGKKSLIEIYTDIKEGYTIGGLTQEIYEDFYERLSGTLEKLSSIHTLVNVFINEKYITEIVEALVGGLDLDSTNISYDGKNFTVNTLMDYYNQGLDETLTQEKVMNLISDSINPNILNTILPYKIESTSPIFMYPYFCMTDIEDSVAIASENVDIVKTNITKQDHILSSLNTLCYDNVVQDINAVVGLAEGSDGDFTYDNSSTAKLKKRENYINDIRIKAYKGTWNEDVINKDICEFDHILDANYHDAVKNAIITLARDERQDFFFWGDTRKQNTISDCIDWKTSFTNSTYFMSILSQAQVWYDEYTSKNIELTSTYLVADLFPRHVTNYGVQYPMAGSRRGVVGGFLSMDWYPNENQKETLYTNKVNYLERDVNVIRIGAQNTNYPSGPLGSINNMLVMLKIKRKVEKIAKTYQFEFNNDETRGSMNAEINNYLKDWVNNGACTSASAEVYSSEYDVLQKIVRVDVVLQFTGVIERIVINIDCPAQ